MTDKIDSNVTGARYTEEVSIKTLPGSPVWYPLEPNSYKDFGGNSKLVARNPINPTRQRKKGTITDFDANGGWNQDLTLNNLTRLFQGFFFADVRERATTAPMNAVALACTSVVGSTTDKYNFSASPGAFVVGNLILASGFGVAANNGLKHVQLVEATDIQTVETLAAEASPPAAAKLVCVGHQGATADLTLTLNGAQVVLGSTVLNFSTLGLVEGQWLWIGGDTTATRFGGAQYGLARIALGGVAAHALTFDKVGWATPGADSGTGKTVQIFFPTILRNEPVSTNIKTRSYQIERTLGSDTDGPMSEYLTGALASELTLNVPQADKINVDLTFVACDNEQRTGAQGLKTGSRPANASEDAINTSSDLARVNLALVTSDAAVAPLFAYATELTLTVNNNLSPNKALGTLGAFNISAGEFDVDGKVTCYFSDVTAVQAVRQNADVTLDFFIAKNNQGLVWDIPLLGLGNGLLSVEANKPITLPLDTSASESPFGYTLALMSFPYLPNLATA